MKEIKHILQIELIPKSCWGSNVRTKVKKKDWDIIRRAVYAKEKMHCHICEELCKPLDAHEVWEFNEETHVQKLIDIIGVCKACHGVIHFGRAQKFGYAEEATIQFFKVNDYCDNIIDLKIEMMRAKSLYLELSEIKDWKLDLSLIEDQGFVVNKE